MSLLSAAQQCYSLSSPTAANTTTMPPHKNDSPAKSAFVPTQVIRNQTPRKPKPNEQNQKYSNDAETGANSLSQQQAQQPQHQQQRKENHKQQQQGSEGTAKPKRQVRNRLAVRFDQMPGKKN